MKRLYILTWCSLALAALTFWFTKPETTSRPAKGLLLDRQWLVSNAASLTPKEHRRAPDQTFLTYPEWFLVFGPAEYAEYLQHHTSTNFPFMTHVFQAWESYSAVDDQTRGVFPPNDEYHTMINVINTSSSIEFGLKSIYETIIGSVTDIGDGEVATAEDRFNAAYASEYVTFLDTAPWYEFDFIARMKTLWLAQPLFGSHMLRKWERRYFLTTDLTVKAAYGWLIKLATKSAYETPSLVTAAIINHLPTKSWPDAKELKVLSTEPDGSTVATLPRYTPLTPIAIELAKQGVTFDEIAGNRTAILLTAVGPSHWETHSTTFMLIFSQPIPTKHGQNRWALATPVASLSQVLRELADQGMRIEHVFDY